MNADDVEIAYLVIIKSHLKRARTYYMRETDSILDGFIQEIEHLIDLTDRKIEELKDAP